MMDFLVKLAQIHETFRLAELQALAILEDVKLEVLQYSDQVCLPTPTLSTTQYTVATLCFRSFGNDTMSSPLSALCGSVLL